jgi:hypothetical protein
MAGFEMCAVYLAEEMAVVYSPSLCADAPSTRVRGHSSTPSNRRI